VGHGGQARCQDFAVGGPKPQEGAHFLHTVLDVCSNRGAKQEMGVTDLKWEGRASLAHRDGPDGGA